MFVPDNLFQTILKNALAYFEVASVMKKKSLVKLPPGCWSRIRGPCKVELRLSSLMMSMVYFFIRQN